jgi:mannose-6-phosphate isomerase-like protein (cupin superfamily)
MNENPVRAFVAAAGDYRWDGVELLRYKEEGSAPFRDVTRQTLFRRPDMRGELRYFEVAPEGYSTLERHEHVHAVMILRGAGHALVGDQVFPVHTFDLVTVPPLTWHQFRAARTSPLGFLCMVDAERDRSQLPSARDLEEMRASPALAAFLSTKAG